MGNNTATNITAAGSSSSSNIEPASVWDMPIPDVKAELREAIQACNERGLYFSARWAAEALNGLPSSEPTESVRETRSSRPPARGPTYPSPWAEELGNIPPGGASPTHEHEQDIHLMGKAFFDLKEFDRAAAVLKGCKSYKKSHFLRLYSKYLVGEKRREQETREVLGPMDTITAVNREIEKIDEELASRYKEGTLDSFGKYLYGVTLIKRQLKALAIPVLIESVNQYPYNWSAWTELALCMPSVGAATNIQPELPNHFMTVFFMSHVSIEQESEQEDFSDRLDVLDRMFPKSAYLKCERAVALYHARDLNESEKVFEELIKEHPHRLEQMDIFANLLYVTNNKTRLSLLAHTCAGTDNFRTETCCVVGNYYGVIGEHDKAIVYFKRALRFNRSYSAAWTLLGHEYLELKNTYAAVEAYRRAVDYDCKDYRAWNGLGQTYEVLKMHSYALNYYQRATSLRPYDGRMWCAMGECYEVLNQDQAAIKCYTRALLGDDQEKIALIKLPKLYKKIGDVEAAAHFFRKSLEQRREEQSESDDRSEACVFLALYERARGHLREAGEYAQEALQCSSEQHQQEAHALLRDIQSRLDEEGEDQDL